MIPMLFSRFHGHGRIAAGIRAPARGEPCRGDEGDQGRAPHPEPDGTLDPAKADAQWDARTDPARRPEPPEDEPAQADETAAADTPAEPRATAAEPAPQGAATFTQARTAHEIAKAQRARIQVQRLREEVVDRAHATSEVFRLARRERDAWVNWPARVAALMAAELGLDAHVMQKVLEAHVRDHLNELAEIRPEFR